MSSTLTIMRQWHSPQIHISVTRDDISISVSLDDFLKMLVDEAIEATVETITHDAGNPSLIMTNKGLKKRMKNAIQSEKIHEILTKHSEAIIDAMKMESSKVM